MPARGVAGIACAVDLRTVHTEGANAHARTTFQRYQCSVAVAVIRITRDWKGS